MTSGSVTPDSLKETTELLRKELPQLEAIQQRLESDLAGVTERLESVRTALAGLRALSLVPRAPGRAAAGGAGPTGTAGAPAPEVSAGQDDGAAEPPVASSVPDHAAVETDAAQPAAPGEGGSPAAQARRTGRPSAAKTTTARQPEPDERTGGLTEQVIQVLTRSGGAPVRARDVASALGRDGSSGSVNAVRSTLDRLVATSRADRAGRGLYLARS